MHIFCIYIFFNFVFFIVLSRIEINETHVNPYLLEPVFYKYLLHYLKYDVCFTQAVSLRMFGS